MMSMQMIDPAEASGQAKLAFDEATAQFGGVINLFKVAGNAPNVLAGILAMNRAVGQGSELSGRQTELVAMLVSALNRCDYCVNVHMQVGKSQGVGEADMLAAMAGHSKDPTEQALLDYADAVVRNRGIVSDTIIEATRRAGFSDKALLEVIGVIGVYTTLQYIRHIGNPDQDFPVVKAFDPNLHGAPML